MTTAEIRRVRRKFTRELQSETGRTILAIAERLIETGDSNLRWVAYELIQHHPAAFALCDARKLAKLGRGMNSWGAVDCFSCYLAGPAWQARQVADDVIYKWARSRDRWWRRAALVATVGLNCKARGGRGDTPRTLRVCRMLATDRDDMVVKAMSWALRELSKRDPDAVRSFLAQQKRLAARVVREVGNKLTTGLKNP